MIYIRILLVLILLAIGGTLINAAHTLAQRSECIGCARG